MAVTAKSEPWSELLAEGRGDGRLVREAFEGAREPELVPIPEGLHPAIYDGLARAGIDALLSHQADALHSALAPTTIVTTGTASGKCLAFNLPAMHALLKRPTARALYLYRRKRWRRTRRARSTA